MEKQSNGKYLTDEEIASNYKDYKIREIFFNPSKKSGYIDIEFPYNEDKCDNFIIYEDNKIGFSYWYPESIYYELCSFINYVKKEENKEES